MTTNEQIRARLDKIEARQDRAGMARDGWRPYAALRAVLDLCDASSRDHVGDGMGGITAGSVRCAIGDALGGGMTGEPRYTEAEIRSAARALWKSEDNVGEYWVVGLLRVLALQRAEVAE